MSPLQYVPTLYAQHADSARALASRLLSCQADLIRRAYVSGQTHQEIACETGLPLGTVKSRIRLGLDKLRCALGPATLRSVDC